MAFGLFQACEPIKSGRRHPRCDFGAESWVELGPFHLLCIPAWQAPFFINQPICTMMTCDLLLDQIPIIF